MHQWSFGKRFRNITFEDFMCSAQQFIKALEKACGGSSQITVVFYKEIPVFCSTPLDGHENALFDRQNKKRELVVLNSIAGVTKNLFEWALYVNVTVIPRDSRNAPAFASGQMSCKGLLPRNIIFHVQSHQISGGVKKAMIGKQGPSKILFSIGDGLEINYQIVRSINNSIYPKTRTCLNPALN